MCRTGPVRAAWAARCAVIAPASVVAHRWSDSPAHSEAGAASRDLRSGLNFLRLPKDGRRPYILLGTEHKLPELPLEYPTELVDIRDARAATVRPTVATAGFELVPGFRTTLDAESFYSDPGMVRSAYYQEVCEAVKQATGAELVLAFHHQVRNETRTADLGGGDLSTLLLDNNPLRGRVDGYARNAHADYTAGVAWSTARQQLRHVEEGEARRRCARGRYMMVNAWRNITSTPIRNHHLAVLDGSSVSRDDVVVVDLHYETFSSESTQLRYNPKQRWFYFPDMQAAELLLMKQFDSDPSARTLQAPHCAFSDPSADSAPPRESVEVRLVAFFPEGRSSRDLLAAPESQPPAAEVVRMIMAHIEQPQQWPDHTRDGLRVALGRNAAQAAAEMISFMVAWHADPENLDAAMPGAPPAMQMEVAELLREACFEERLWANFGPGAAS